MWLLKSYWDYCVFSIHRAYNNRSNGRSISVGWLIGRSIAHIAYIHKISDNQLIYMCVSVSYTLCALQSNFSIRHYENVTVCKNHERISQNKMNEIDNLRSIDEINGFLSYNRSRFHRINQSHLFYMRYHLTIFLC